MVIRGRFLLEYPLTRQNVTVCLQESRVLVFSFKETILELMAAVHWSTSFLLMEYEWLGSKVAIYRRKADE